MIKFILSMSISPMLILTYFLIILTCRAREKKSNTKHKHLFPSAYNRNLLGMYSKRIKPSYSACHRAGVVVFANNSVIFVSATTKLDQNLVRLTP